MTQKPLMRRVLLTAAAVGDVRTEQLMGREYRVVPAVLVQSQVLNNNLGRSYLPPEDITSAWAIHWNGVPVVVGDHPTVRGVSVSARSPDVLNAMGAGFIFGAHVDTVGDIAQLKAEVWLEVARAEQLGELKTILARLKKGETVELSTGFNTLVEVTPGTVNNEQYDLILHPVDADHLAVFAEKVGACSLDDGCGLGVNKQEGGNVKDDKAKEATGLLSRALAMLSGSKGDDEPKCANNCGTTCSCKPKTPAQHVSHPLVTRLTKWGAALPDVCQAIGLVRAEQAEYPESDEEVRTQIRLALEKEYGGQNRYLWIEAVYSADNTVVFCVVLDTLEGRTEQYWQATYNRAEDGAVTFANPTQVVRRVVYEPAANNRSTEETMKQEEPAKPAAAAANAAPPAAPPAPPAANADTPVPPAAPAAPAAPVANAEIAQLTKLIGDLTTAVQKQGEAIADLKKVSAPAIAEAERERQALVKALAGNQNVPYEEADLEAKPVEDLRKLAQMAGMQGAFIGRGAPRVAGNGSEEEPEFMPVTPYFAGQKKKGDEPGKEGK